MKNSYKGLLPLVLMVFAGTVSAQDYPSGAESNGRADPSLHLQQGSTQKEAQKVNEQIYQATGFGNTFMVVTDEGNVIIDTSLEAMAPHHKKLLSAVSDGPIHSVILTHGHGDHTGGVALWRQADTRVVAQQNMVEFLHYQKRLEGMFTLRNRAQFGFDPGEELEPRVEVENFAAEFLPNTLFDAEFQFTLGGTEFEVIHTPAETYDALTVWMPQYKAAFVGDMFYRSFPNIYTLRGTKPRWALDYVASIDRVLALEPELLLPSHGEPITGKTAIREALTRYRDAIQYVHDQTVLGMNQGKDVYTLMRDIRLPEKLDLGETYGWVSWSVRGIYQGYMGWFDGDPVNMYAEAPESIYADLVSLAGGPEKVVALASKRSEQGELVKGLRLVDAALAADPSSADALILRLKVLTQLREQSGNLNESGWLNYGIADTKHRMKVQANLAR